MSSCICGFHDPGSVYPVLDPLRMFAQRPRYVFGYGMAWDTFRITIDDAPWLTRCQMNVALSAEPTAWWRKELVAWNYCLGAPVAQLSTEGTQLGPHSMVIERGECEDGTDTLLLKKMMYWNQMVGLYTFRTDQLWAFWGGKSITIHWFSDRIGNGIWGPDTHITYPRPARSRTVLQDSTSPAMFLFVRGAKYWIPDNATGAALELDLSTAIPTSPTELNAMSSVPADFTLLQELSNPRVYVIYGGAKFWIASPAELSLLGFTFAEVTIIPDGAIAGIPTVPRDGSLLMERGDPHVFLVEGGQLRWVPSPEALYQHCLYGENVRTAPQNSLGSLPVGPTLT